MNLGEQLGDITRRLDAATNAWAAAGYPDHGPAVDVREAVYADLRAWNQKAAENAGPQPWPDNYLSDYDLADYELDQRDER